MGSDEEGLQSGGEGGDGTERMLGKRLLEMRQGELSGIVRRDPGWFAQSSQRRADGGLGAQKSFPDSVGGRITQSAVECPKGGPFIVGLSGLRKKRPQVVSAEKQSPDLIGHPDAKGSSAAFAPFSVTAENPYGADSFLELVFRIVAAQKAVPD